MKPIRPVPTFLYATAMVAMLAAGLAGCRSFSLSPRPHVPANGIALQPREPVQGTIDTGDLVLSYALAVTFAPARRLHLSGRVLSARTRADKTTVYLHLLDSAGHVMDTSVLYASGFRPPTYIRRPESFDTTLALPPGAAAIAFTSFIQPSAGHK